MEHQAVLGLETELNRDTNQAIFILALLKALQSTASHETPNHSQYICSHDYDQLQDLGAQNLSGIAEIS